MTLKIQLSRELSRELYGHIRSLVHDELNRQKNRQKIEQLGVKIRGQLDELSGPNKSTIGLRIDLRSVQNG